MRTVRVKQKTWASFKNFEKLLCNSFSFSYTWHRLGLIKTTCRNFESNEWDTDLKSDFLKPTGSSDAENRNTWMLWNVFPEEKCFGLVIYDSIFKKILEYVIDMIVVFVYKTHFEYTSIHCKINVFPLKALTKKTGTQQLMHNSWSAG